MKTLATLMVCAAGLLAQDGTRTAPTLTDSELGQLGGYVAEQVDAVTDPAALEKSILTKIEEIRKASTGEKKVESPVAKGKGKKKKKAAPSKAAASADSIKNGLTEADRLALGKFVVSEITSGHQGEAFASALKKELERIRAERVKASSGESQPRKKRKKT